MIDKSGYENIEIPGELDQVVQDALAEDWSSGVKTELVTFPDGWVLWPLCFSCALLRR